MRKKQDIYFFDFEGNLDFQSVDHLKVFWAKKGLKKKKIIFNFKSLFFVGSRGFSDFSETVKNIDKENFLKICCASSEFKKFFSSKGLSSILFEYERDAMSSFNSSQEDTINNKYPPMYQD